MYLAVGGRTWEQTSRPNELVSAWGELPVDQDIWGWEHDRGEGGHDDDFVVGLPVPQVLVLVTVGVLAENGTSGEPSVPQVED